MRSVSATARALLRLPIRCLPDRMPVPVFSGPNRGRWWRAGSSVPHCVTGSYERAKAEAVAARLRPGMTVWDIGANVGYYALLAARRVGPAGCVMALEPLPANAAAVMDHAALNGLANITVVPAAAGRTPGTAPFRLGAHHMEGALAAGRSPLRVPVVTLDGLRRGGLPAPDLVKMDIEGGEADALRGAAALLRARRTAWFIAVHSPALRRACAALFGAAGYRVSTLEGGPDLARADDLVAEPRRR